MHNTFNIIQINKVLYIHTYLLFALSAKCVKQKIALTDAKILCYKGKDYCHILLTKHQLATIMKKLFYVAKTFC